MQENIECFDWLKVHYHLAKYCIWGGLSCISMLYLEKSLFMSNYKYAMLAQYQVTLGAANSRKAEKWQGYQSSSG